VRVLYDKLIAVYSNPREILEYEHPKDRVGSTLTHIWTSINSISEYDFKNLLDNKMIIRLSENNGDGLYQADACYYYKDTKNV
jgi:hypothetical protein